MEIELSCEEVLEGLVDYLEGEEEVEIDERYVPIPPELERFVVARSKHVYALPWGWGSHYRALVAIGGAELSELGELKAGACFASMTFNKERKVITVHFCSAPP